MNACRAAIDALFADPNLATDAVYHAGGRNHGTTLRAIVRQPDRVGTFGETRIASATMMFDIRTSDVAAPAEGDTIERNGTVYVVQGKPIRDAERLVWMIEARAH